MAALALCSAAGLGKSVLALLCGSATEKCSTVRLATAGHRRHVFVQVPRRIPSLEAPLALKPRWQRPLYLALGCLSLVIGVVALVVPLIPGIVFLVLATACFSRSSPRMERWLTTHPRFGGLIRGWQSAGAIPRSAKWIVTISMFASFSLIFLETSSRSLQAVVAAVMICVLFYVWRRPENVVLAG